MGATAARRRTAAARAEGGGRWGPSGHFIARGLSFQQQLSSSISEQARTRAAHTHGGIASSLLPLHIARCESCRYSAIYCTHLTNVPSALLPMSVPRASPQALDAATAAQATAAAELARRQEELEGLQAAAAEAEAANDRTKKELAAQQQVAGVWWDRGVRCSQICEQRFKATSIVAVCKPEELLAGRRWC
jgi:hypothetical protein